MSKNYKIKFVPGPKEKTGRGKIFQNGSIGGYVMEGKRRVWRIYGGAAIAQDMQTTVQSANVNVTTRTAKNLIGQEGKSNNKLDSSGTKISVTRSYSVDICANYMNDSQDICEAHGDMCYWGPTNTSQSAKTICLPREFQQYTSQNTNHPEIETYINITQPVYNSEIDNFIMFAFQN